MENELSNKIIQYEKRLISKQESACVLQDLLDDDFMEMSQSGNIGKQDVIAWLNRHSKSEREGFQFQAKMISEDVILLTYISRIKEVNANNVQQTFRSSIWRKLGGQWRMVFHQGTPIHEMI
ncbi:DUF4440 domain-containing protein [Legionella yabuuchiae]|uniref:nuclear transport factor 2 family protein n=1 Tax=Legionella yabuuchiae TaxID=376727 RepID=UPI0010542C8A|nr:DUF4440 domain-containing protein [Legionella yabuuchiae]